MLRPHADPALRLLAVPTAALLPAVHVAGARDAVLPGARGVRGEAGRPGGARLAGARGPVRGARVRHADGAQREHGDAPDADRGPERLQGHRLADADVAVAAPRRPRPTRLLRRHRPGRQGPVLRPPPAPRPPAAGAPRPLRADHLLHPDRRAPHPRDPRPVPRLRAHPRARGRDHPRGQGVGLQSPVRGGGVAHHREVFVGVSFGFDLIQPCGGSAVRKVDVRFVMG
ncbi:uncharacterized protein BO72DRAFT_511111, partial [Aspergillus fijiensis CBS 313.89]